MTSDRSQPFISLTSSHVLQPEGERDCSTVWCCWTDLLFVLLFFNTMALAMTALVSSILTPFNMMIMAKTEGLGWILGL